MDSPCLRDALRVIQVAVVLVSAVAHPVAAQTQDCNLLTKQLLSHLEGGPPQTLDAEAERQRSQLRAQGCDPQLTGYDTQIESIKLNQELDFKPEEKKGPPFRLDKLIQIEY